jgi:hypothetical protein
MNQILNSGYLMNYYLYNPIIENEKEMNEDMDDMIKK